MGSFPSGDRDVIRCKESGRCAYFRITRGATFLCKRDLAEGFGFEPVFFLGNVRCGTGGCGQHTMRRVTSGVGGEIGGRVAAIRGGVFCFSIAKECRRSRCGGEFFDGG
jgi:hypothetical protein